MGVIEETIQNVLSNLDTPPTYLRASKLEEANVELSQIDTSSAVAIYYNLPIIVAEMVMGRPLEIHPVKISFVKKAGLDNTGVADDTIRDAMETLAAEFYDSLVLNWSDTFEKFDGYTMDPVSMDKPFDEKMVGFSLEFDIKLLRGVQAKIISADPPSTWVAFVTDVGRGYNYPIPTFQSSLITGDDGDIEATIFGATNRNAQSIKARNTLASYNVLNNTNAWGTTVRLTDELGTEIFANNLILDNYTGLMFYNVFQTAAIWPTAIAAAIASTQGGYDDWFMTNIPQLTSIMYFEDANETLAKTPFNLTLNNTYMWTSTTQAGLTTGAYALKESGDLALWTWDPRIKATVSLKYVLCRKHY